MMVIGLPRALHYYRYAPMLRAFFEALGTEVIVSPPTTRETLSQGASRVVGETCMPVKLYCGHILALVGRVDRIFVPAIHSLHLAYSESGSGMRACPKLVGLPDLIADVIPEAPLLVVDVDAQGRHRTLEEALSALGKRLTLNPLRVKRALRCAQAAQDRYCALLYRGVDLSRALSHAPMSPHMVQPESLTIAVVGYPYNLYDAYATHRLIDRTRALGVRICTPYGVSPEERWTSVQRLAGEPYWTYEDEIVGAAGSYLRRDVDGLITVSAFGCAPDSVMLSVVAQAAQDANVPHMALILDEHSGEAGLVTRLEAFVDMLARRSSPLVAVHY